MASGNQDGPARTKAVQAGVSERGVDRDDPAFNAQTFNATTARLLRREALRRAAAEMNTTSGPGLEDMLERISAEVTAEAAETLARTKKP